MCLLGHFPAPQEKLSHPELTFPIPREGRASPSSLACRRDKCAQGVLCYCGDKRWDVPQNSCWAWGPPCWLLHPQGKARSCALTHVLEMLVKVTASFSISSCTTPPPFTFIPAVIAITECLPEGGLGQVPGPW